MAPLGCMADTQTTQPTEQAGEKWAQAVKMLRDANRARDEQAMTAYLRLSRPEVAAAAATFKRNLYDNLLAQGFSRDEALALTKDTPLPEFCEGAGRK